MHHTFEAFYNAVLKPLLEPIEKQRLNSRNTKLIAGVLIVVLAILVGISTASLFGPIFIIVIGMSVFYYLQGKKDDKLNIQYKETVIAKMVTDVFGLLQYTTVGSFDIATFCNCGLFHKIPTRFLPEDCFSGIKNNMAFNFCEITAAYENEDSEGNTNVIKIFNGIILCIQIPVYFSGTTIVVPKNGNGNNNTATLFNQNAAFEKQFDIYGNVPDELPKLITPQFMECFINVFEALQTTIKASFYNQQLIVTFPTLKNRFEMSDWSSVFNPEKLKEELEFVYQLLHLVNLISIY